MPIEIKELNIKINVEEAVKHQELQNVSPLKIKELKAEITRACTRNVIEYIKEKQER